MTPTGYAIERFELRLGESRLNGSGTLDIAGARPRLDLRVEAPRIQLDDFPWERAPAPAGALTVDSLRGSASGVATRTQRLLGAQVLGRFDAHVDIEARQVLSGRDMLGDGALRLQLTDGRLQVGPALVNLPGGSAGLSGDYDPSTGTVRLAVGVHGDNFEYGVLARRGRPDADTEGRFSLDLALISSADSLNAILASASGMIDLIAWPRNLGVRQVDFWVVNLLRTLLPFFARGEPSVVNCVVGRFNLVDGKLHDEVFILDTTRVRVFGAGSIDFATKAVDLRFHPRVKGLGLGAIEPPIRVTGTLSDFRVGVTPGDFFGAVKRFFTSLVVVPLQTLFRGPIPADGRDICEAAPGAPADRRP
jgi:hypothetical protein